MVTTRLASAGTDNTNDVQETISAQTLVLDRPSFELIRPRVRNDADTADITGTQSFSSSFNRIRITAQSYAQPVTFDNLEDVNSVLSANTTLPLVTPLNSTTLSQTTLTNSITVDLDNVDRITRSSSANLQFRLTANWAYDTIFTPPTVLAAALARTESVTYPTFGFDVWAGTVPSSYDATDFAAITLDNLQNNNLAGTELFTANNSVMLGGRPCYTY